MISIATLLLVVATQGDGATLSGVVRDAATGEPLPGAVVTLADLDRASATGPDGGYRFSGVPAGPRHLEVRRLGYETRTLHALVPATGWVQIDLSLSPRPLALRPVEAYGPVAVRGAERAADADPHPAVALSAEAIRDHPLLAEPDPLAALAGGAVGAQPEQPRGLHVRGGSADQVGYLIDGVPVLSPFHAAGLFGAWEADALAGVRLDPTPPAEAAADALSGVVQAETLVPGRVLRAQGSAGTAQAHLTVDGPLPALHGGFLFSARRGFPGVPDPKEESTYLAGHSSDWLAKLQGAVAGGAFRVLAFGSRNASNAAALPTPDGPPSSGEPRNRFAWSGLSWGGEWSRPLAGGRLRLRGWRAGADAAARWASDDPAAAALAASRVDAGGAATYELGDSAASTVVGVRASRSRGDYRVGPAAAGAPPAYLVAGETHVAALFARAVRPLGAHAAVEAGLLAASYDDRARLAPQLQLRWTPVPALTLSAGASRTHQPEQALHNPESVVGYLFPPALNAGAGADGVPVARSDQAFVAAGLRPSPGVRVAAQAYARSFDGLVLVAPATAQPFATGGFAVGRGTARGAALEVAASGARYALLASYGWSRVRLAYGDSTYVPDFAATHTLDAGILFFPQAATAVRLSLSGAAGRRTTAVSGPFEWEGCNLGDSGCEFAGSPQLRAEPLGGTRLPAYLRVDLGVRRHWHLRLGGRTGMLGVHATVTNLLDRHNLLTVRVDPATGAREPVEMRARGPLVAGVDWRF
ncbi:MAG TPA: TonB-dependent receptor [Longimicrobium sp.]|jgi:hypothetical protein|nr:TonB-dependent receptor [Longimicrobium sp.]